MTRFNRYSIALFGIFFLNVHILSAQDNKLLEQKKMLASAPKRFYVQSHYTKTSGKNFIRLENSSDSTASKLVSDPRLTNLTPRKEAPRHTSNNAPQQ